MMWAKDGPNSEHARPSSGSEVMVIDDHLVPCAGAAAAALEVPVITNMNIQNSKNVQVGPKVKNVYTTVHNNEVIKGRWLGLEVVTPRAARRLRCCVVVFICWAVVLACGLALYFIYVALPKQGKLDLDLSCGKYLWHLVKNSTRAERLACTAAMLLIAICAALILYFTVFYTAHTEEPDTAPAEWYITRDMWLAAPYNNTSIVQSFEPLRLVVIQHSVSTECYRFDRCASELRNLQDWFIKFKDRDLPYNFVIGNDGRAYEARGWRTEGAHTYGYNRCSVGIGFVGDYREEKGATHTRVSEAQQNRTHLLLAEGVKRGYLHPEYLVVGGKDLRDTASPGSDLYKAIQRWKHYDHENRFFNMTCEEINVTTFGKSVSQ